MCKRLEYNSGEAFVEELGASASNSKLTSEIFVRMGEIGESNEAIIA